MNPIDWGAPWLAPLAPFAETDPPGLPVRFVPAAELPAGEAYEAFIAHTGRVPTRANLHDHFNRIVWRAHPALKARLNQLQAAAIAAQGIGPNRGALRDALTLFDEHGAWWPAAPAPLAQALRVHDWRSLFVTHRALWAGHRLQLFGHALLEQLAAAPRKGLTAHVLLADDPLALSAADWAAKPFAPLPVCGIPGWWPPNQDPAFYEDKAVFRPARLKHTPAP